MNKYKVISGIYEILNKINNKRYIGESCNCHQRKLQHYNLLRKNKHPNPHLQNAWNKYGEESFTFSVIEEVNDLEYRAEREIYWIFYYDSYKNGYNRTTGGDRTKFVKFSNERNKKISKKNTGKKYPQNSGKFSATARKIVCVNTGEEFGCIKYAIKKFNISYSGIISSCKNLTTVSANSDLVFLYKEYYDSLSHDELLKILENAINYRKRDKKYCSIEVICLNNNKIFKDCKVASKIYHTDNSYMHKCCKNLCASAGKDEYGNPLTWMYLCDYNNSDEKIIKEKIKKCFEDGSKNSKKSIKCITTGEVFESISDAARRYKINKSSLYSNINRGCKYPCGKDDKNNLDLFWEVL